MNTDTPVPAARAVRRSIRTAAIVACVVLLPVAAHRLWDYVEIRRLVDEVQQIKRRGEPVTEWQATGPPREPGHDSAGRYYLAGAMLALGSGPARETAAAREWLASAPPGAALPEARVEMLASAVNENLDALQLADTAAQRAFAGLPSGTDYSYRTASLAALSSLVSARTLHLATTSQGDDAVRSALVWLQLRRAIRSSLWVSVGAHDVTAVLSLSRPSAGLLQPLQEALAAGERPDHLLDTLVRERARYLDVVWRRHYGATPDAPEAFGMPISGTLFRPVISRHAVSALRVWAVLIDVARRPRAEWAPRYEELRTQYSSPRRGQAGGIFATMVGAEVPLGIFGAALDGDPLIVDRAARAAVAVERYRRDHADALPPSLADLVPAYLDAVPIDPYSERPLLYRAAETAYTIYSVGPDLKDDAGDLRSELRRTMDQGWGRRAIRGADIGVRVALAHQP